MADLIEDDPIFAIFNLSYNSHPLQRESKISYTLGYSLVLVSLAGRIAKVGGL